MRRVLSGGLLLMVLGLASQAQAQTPAWRSGFETGFPGEFLDYDGGAYTADGTPNAGVNEAWTIVDTSDSHVFAGEHSYRGWPVGTQADSHRAYPVLHCDIPSPFVNSFMVYQELDYNALDPSEWVHFATWGNNPDWVVHTMSVRDRKLEMAHLDWSYIGPQPQPDFPLNQWVRFTAYINYEGAEGYIRVWQDGTPVLEGTFTDSAGTSLMRAHWGWYSSGSIDQGVQYNDEIQIWTLDAPLEDLETEPPSPYDPDPPPNGGAGPGGAGPGGTGPGGQGTGAGNTGATGPATHPAASDTEDDCGCRFGPDPRNPRSVWLLLALAGLSALRRGRAGRGTGPASGRPVDPNSSLRERRS